MLSCNEWKSDVCMASMYKMRPQLCDVSLVTEDGEVIVAHRVVLASTLQYFYAMFVGCNGSQYIESDLHEIQIKSISGFALQEIVKWCYTGCVDTNEDNVQQLLSGAKMLDCSHIVSICSNFIESKLHSENALGIYDFAEMLGCVDLQQFTLNYIHNNFILIANQSEEFLQLSCHRLSEIISSDYIDAGESGEHAVLEALMSWINYDKVERNKFLPTLIQHIRFPRLSQQSLVRIEDEYPLIKSDTTCKDLLIEAMKYHLIIQCKDQMNAVSNNARFRMRAPRGRPKCLVIVGGQAPKAIRHCEYYDFTTNKWSDLPTELPSRRCRAGLSVLNGIVYAIGGFNGSLRVRTVDCYDPQTNQWTTCPSMEARRSTLGVGVLHNLIYAVGGFDGSIGLQSAEVYNPLTHLWQYISPMSTRRSSVGVATLNGMLYAVGGYDGSSRQCLSSVEYYNPLSDSWTLICDMSQRRSGAGVGVLDGRLYAIGGHDGPAVRKSVECYDPESNSWMQCSDMIIARRNAGVVTKDGLVYVIGGDDGQSNLSSVEVFNPKVNSWSLLPMHMSIGRSYAGVAIVDKTWS